MADIFIGYASDDQARVEPLARALQAQGWSVFWDSEILPSETWREVIDKELGAAKSIVVVWTKNSVSKRWVIEEADEGASRNILIPVLMDPITQVKIPRGFRELQCADLAQWKGGTEESSFRQLVKSVSRKAGPPPIQKPEVQEEESRETGSRKTDDFLSVIGKKVVVPLAVVAIAVLIIMWFVQTRREITGKDGAPMVLVPAGEFIMGSNDGEEDEKPERRVTLDTFYMDKYEVSTRVYAAFLQATGRARPDDWSKQVALVGSGDRPVVNVTWHDADAYCRQYGKRLPTEAEWEKAARETDGRTYPWGNEEPTNQHALFNARWNGYGTLATVESYEAGKSPYGLYHMAGNVWEWVADWYDEDYYQKTPDRNPKGPSTGNTKVLRGGSWLDEPRVVRSADRDRYLPMFRGATDGFRCPRDAR